MGVNAKGTFFVSQAVTSYIIANNIKGHILNVSSSSALRPAWEPYQMSKWAVRGFTAGLVHKMINHGIVVNAIAPGKTATSMLGRSNRNSLYNKECPEGNI
ncbi:MAG: SDR family oxidoreductase [Clostridia bacterium]|nr:SDR family oxidoreductase [Clostridia bacterium]